MSSYCLRTDLTTITSKILLALQKTKMSPTNIRYRVGFVCVGSYGSGTESNSTSRITCAVKTDTRGKHVVLVEDIVDTGHTLSCLIPYLEKRGASSVSVCTLLDKSCRPKVRFELFGGGKFYKGFE